MSDDGSDDAPPPPPALRRLTDESEVPSSQNESEEEPPRGRVPVTLLVLYALASITITLPDTAVTQLLNAKRVPQETQLRLFAAAFASSVPKPLYGALVDATRPSLVFAVAALLSAIGYAVLSVAATTRQISVAYVSLNACEALAEMALSARLADAVAQGVAASRAQGLARCGNQISGLATAARWTGSLVAAATSLSIYRCGRAAPSPAMLFRATAAVALVSFVVAFGDRRAPKKKVSRLPRVVLFAAIAQAAALGAGGLCGAWVNVGCALVAGLCGFLALAARERPSELAAPLLEEEERRPRLGPPALLLFALEAMPSMGPTLTNVEFWLLFARKPCAPPLLSLASVAASLLACGAYGFRRSENDRLWLAATTVTSALASLPRAGLTLLRPLGANAGGRRKMWGLGRVDVVLVTKCLASFFGEASTLASSTYALRLAARVPGANRARTYGALLSLFDAGGACGAALSAALARHVVYGVWEHVPRLVMVCSALAVAPLGLLFLV